MKYLPRLARTAPIFLAAVSIAVCWIVFAPPAAAQEKWTQANPLHVPEGRDDAMMAFDSVRGVVVMFGGDRGGSGTWEWDGLDWKDLGITGPAARREAAMVFDSRRGLIVMFGGWDFTLFSNITWEFNGTEWTAADPEVVPNGRSDHAMAFDEARGVTVMYGGESSDDSTWLWDGTNWTEITSTEVPSPGFLWGHAMAYDRARQVVVLFGGANEALSTLVNNTWIWDGSTWTNVTPADNNPPAMRDHVMVYDSARQKIVLFGGRDVDNTGFDATWEWDGSAWTQISTGNQPSKRHESAAAFDSWRNRMVLFGGGAGDDDSDRYHNDTWLYPNLPPDIDHAAVSEVLYPGTAREIGATIIDYDGDATSNYLYYRITGDSGYTPVKMTAGENHRFAATVPGEAITLAGLEYYLTATDPAGSGKTSFSGSAAAPVSVRVASTGTLQVVIYPKPAIRNGAQWKLSTETEWRDSGQTLELNPGTYTLVYAESERWNRPASQTVEVRIGETTAVKAEYTNRAKDMGTLKVVLEPEKVRQAGAMWRIGGTDTWHHSGQSVDLDPGSYTVVCADIDGWTRPANKRITIPRSGKVSVNLEYTR